MVGWIFAHYGVPLARFAVVSAVLIAGILLGVRAFYTHVVVAPYTKDQALKRLLTDPQPATVYGDLPPELEQGAEGPAGLTQIEERGVLRVCFAPDAYPTSFYNDAEPPQLVGFDIEMAHRFASSIELPIAFIATSVERDAVKRLESGACDILMRSTRLGPDTTQQYRMTSPVYESAVGIMIRDHRRSEVQTWDAIRGLGDSMRIAIDGSPGSLRFMTALLPQPELLPLYDAKEFVSIMESGAPNAPGRSRGWPKRPRPGRCSSPLSATSCRSRPCSSRYHTRSPAGTQTCRSPSMPGSSPRRPRAPSMRCIGTGCWEKRLESTSRRAGR
jgi:ABC-type amino acid transport substrate-binding protein